MAILQRRPRAQCGRARLPLKSHECTSHSFKSRKNSMDRLDELAIFVRIVEEGSLARAAARLRRSPPAVTRALASLEGRIGLRLIDRTTRRLAASEAGRALYDRARALLADYESATTDAADAPVRGLLRVTAPVQFGRRHIAPIVSRFLDAHDRVEVELVLNDRNIDLIEEGIDVALRIGPLADSSLSARLVGHVRQLWVASPAYLERRGTPRAPADLARHEALLGTLRGNTEWSFARARRPWHRPAAVLSGGRRHRGGPAGAPVARLRARAFAGPSLDQGSGASRAQDRRLPRLRRQAAAHASGAAGRLTPWSRPERSR